MTTERISLDHVTLSELTAGLLSRAWDTFKSWRQRKQQLETLARFDAHMLEDIGITEAEVWRETRLAFWSR